MARYSDRARDLARFQADPADTILDEAVGRGGTTLGGQADEAALYTLMLFARRAAARGLRDGNLQTVRRGVHALALVDTERIDSRDFSADFPLYGIHALGGDVGHEIAQALTICPPATARSLEATRERAGRLTLADCGLLQIRTHYGVGFMEAWTRYETPPVGLAQAGIDLADLLEGEGTYVKPSLRITDLPGVWFGLGRSRKVPVSGCLSLNAEHVRASQRWSHGLLVFLAELGSEAEAQTLVGAAQQANTAQRPRIAIHIGQRLGLLIAGSSTAREESLETIDSLRRLLPLVSTAI